MDNKWTYIYKVLATIHNYDNSLSKERLIDKIVNKYNLSKDRKIYFDDNLAIRFSYSKNGKFSNTILSLSHLQKYDFYPDAVLFTKDFYAFLLVSRVVQTHNQPYKGGSISPSAWGFP